MDANKIDLNILNNLKELELSLNEKLFLELNFVFNKDFNENIELMFNFLSKKDGDQLSKIAHKLKSSSLNLGVLNITSKCLEIETESKNKNFDIIREKIEFINEEWKKINVFFSELNYDLEKIIDKLRSR